MTSLLPPHTNHPMRIENDKDTEVLDLDDLDDLFNQYVETDLLQQFEETTAEPSSSDDLVHLFEFPSLDGTDQVKTWPMPDWDTSVGDAWHEALQNLRQNPASPILPSDSFSVYPESRGKASLSDSKLFSFDNLFGLDQDLPRLSLSTPSTPKAQVAPPLKKATSILDGLERNGIYKPSKKFTISKTAKMMRPSHYRPGGPDLWTCKIEAVADKLSLQTAPNEIPQSPTPSTKYVQDESLNGFFAQDQPYTIAMPPLPGDPHTPDLNYQLTPLSSPTMDASSRNNSGNSFQFSNDNMASVYIANHVSQAALSALQTPPSSHSLPMAPWGPDTPASLSFSFSASPDFHSTTAGKTAGWWDDHNIAAAQPSTPSPNFVDSHSCSTGQTTGDFGAGSDSVTGLGITCDTMSFSGFGSELQPGESSANGHDLSATASSFDLSYTPLYSPAADFPIGQPLPNPLHSPSRSPSLSPQPQFTRRRHSSTRTTTTHQRRKSSNSSTQSTGRASVGFVNFTPEDSRKILTGVAPSGSSKTKARREKEAAEKRRKLSQAAMKAIIEAGGDLGRLEKEGLLIMEP